MSDMRKSRPSRSRLHLTGRAGVLKQVVPENSDVTITVFRWLWSPIAPRWVFAFLWFLSFQGPDKEKSFQGVWCVLSRTQQNFVLMAKYISIFWIIHLVRLDPKRVDCEVSCSCWSCFPPWGIPAAAPPQVRGTHDSKGWLIWQSAASEQTLDAVSLIY